MIFCKYKDVLGKPYEGFHSTRFLGLALGDLLGALLIAILLSYGFQKSLIYMLVIVFLITQISHMLFCVNTAFMNNVLNIEFENNK
jgi:hypothetical protein